MRRISLVLVRSSLLVLAPIVVHAQGQPPAVPEPEPVVAPIPEPVVAPIPEPVVAPIPEPVVAPIPEPVAMPIPEPAIKPEHEPAAAALPEEPPAEEDAPQSKDALLDKPSPHQGHFIALGLHGALATVNDRDRGRRGPALGQGLSLRIGERITDRLDLGLALAYASVYGEDPWSFGRITVHAQGYVTKKSFIHAGFGFGAAGGGDPEDPDFSRGRFGDVYTVGAGHNFYISDESKSGGWLVTPVVTAEYGRDDTFPNAGVWLGVEISHWWGIPRNQLGLDFDEAYKRRE
ncbi:MAG: hypothetical protein GY811_17690 [Myxococcales bacterium]|nr:hypothetical protein [Myxococcales bacterium]